MIMKRKLTCCVCLVCDLFIGCVDDGVDPWEEDYDDEEAMADEAEANGWVDPQSAESQGQEEQMDDSAPSGQLIIPLPDPPKTGILKGGKLWRGAVNNNNSSSGAGGSQNNSTPTSSTTTTTSSSSAVAGGGEEATLSRHGEKSPAVRFIHLNDSQPDCAESSGAAGGQTQRAGHHSAFQQLFPRARKLLQELPEAEIQRLTTAARANNAPSAVSSSRAVTSLPSHSTDTASDLKYERIIVLPEPLVPVPKLFPSRSGSLSFLFPRPEIFILFFFFFPDVRSVSIHPFSLMRILCVRAFLLRVPTNRERDGSLTFFFCFRLSVASV